MMSVTMTEHVLPEQLLKKKKKLLAAPVYPEDWECCDNGCEELCVYEIYRVQKKAYDEQQSRLKQLYQDSKTTD